MGVQDDARLNAHERAALAGIEMKAAAEDPLLARRLKGSGWNLLVARVHKARTRMRRSWFAAPLIAVGLVLVTLSLSIAWPLGVVGSLMTMGGLWMLATGVQQRGAKRARTGSAQ